MKLIRCKLAIIFIYIFISVSASFAENTLNFESIVINASMKERIMRSSLKEVIQRHDGKKFVAYLYAEDESRKKREYYARFTGELTTTISKTGHYYIYLYDTRADSFLPYRTLIYSDDGETTFNVDGAELIVLAGSKEKKSDVLFISQFGGSYTNVYEAYGFSENGLYLKNYLFVGKEKHTQFTGLIGSGKKNYKLGAQIVHNGLPSYMLELSIYLSKTDGEITVQLLNKPPKEAEPFDY